MGRLYLSFLLALAMAGCTAHPDFTYPALQWPFVPKSEIGKPYIEGTKTPGQVRAERLKQVLAAWEARPRLPVVEEFQIGPDDILEANYYFFGAADASDRVIMIERTVPEDGMISLPWVGDVQVVGLTIRQLEQRMRTAGAAFVKEPAVAVNVKEYRSSGVMVSGAVNKPGVYYLVKGRRTVLDLISKVGGLQWGAQGGSWSGGGTIAGELPEHLIVFRKRAGPPTLPGQEEAPKDQGAGKEKGPAPGAKGGEKGEPKPQAGEKPGPGPAEPGTEVHELVEDFLKKHKPPAKTLGKTVKGAPVEQSEESIVLGKSESEIAAEELAIEWANPMLAGREHIVVDLRQLIDEGNLLYNIELQNDDMVHVVPVVNKYIFVAGYVNAPGIFIMTPRMQLDVVKAVTMAGGLQDAARSDETYLIRQTDAGLKRVKVDLVLMHTGVRPPVYLQPGDAVVVGTHWAVRVMDAWNLNLNQAWNKHLQFQGATSSFGFVP